MSGAIENVGETVLDELFDCLNIGAVLEKKFENFLKISNHVIRLADDIFENLAVSQTMLTKFLEF